LLKKYAIGKVFANEDYEQYAIDRDKEIASLLKEHDAELKLYKDQVVFSKNEILKDDAQPYTVFTPYSKKWLARLNEFYLESYPTKKYFKIFISNLRIAFRLSTGWDLKKLAGLFLRKK
jgi:deoxyribodipyrimidine photo-lyase